MSEADQLYRKGTSLLDSDAERAIDFLTQSLQLEPNAPPAIYNRAVAYASLGRDAEALADVDRLEEVAPEIGRGLRAELAASAAPYTDIGIHEYELGNFKKAIKAFNSAVTYDPTFANAWVGKGIAMEELGKTDEALSCYAKAAGVEPDNFYIYLNRAELYQEHERLQEAIDDYTKAIELSPDAPDGYLGRAGVYSQIQMDSEAARDLQKAEELKGTSQNEAGQAP